MRNHIFFWLIFYFACPFGACAASELCKEIDGEFLFFGEWVSLSEHSTDGPVGKLSARNSQPRPQLNRQATLHIPNLEQVSPTSVRITFDEKNQKVELLDGGQNDKANSTPDRKSKNFDLGFKCINSKWQRESSFNGSTSDSGKVSVRQNVFLATDQDDNLIATGRYESQTGSWFKTVVTTSWVAKFQKSMQK